MIYYEYYKTLVRMIQSTHLHMYVSKSLCHQVLDACRWLTGYWWYK